jgi:hypothetical protein
LGPLAAIQAGFGGSGHDLEQGSGPGHDIRVNDFGQNPLGAGHLIGRGAGVQPQDIPWRYPVD